MNIYQFIIWFITGALLLATVVMAAVVAAQAIAICMLFIWSAKRHLGRTKP